MIQTSHRGMGKMNASDKASFAVMLFIELTIVGLVIVAIAHGIARWIERRKKDD